MAHQPLSAPPFAGAFAGRSGEEATGPAAPSWFLLALLVGIGARVLVWLAVFALLLFGLFTFPIFVAGGFLLAMLLFRLVRPVRT